MHTNTKTRNPPRRPQVLLQWSKERKVMRPTRRFVSLWCSVFKRNQSLPLLRLDRSICSSSRSAESGSTAAAGLTPGWGRQDCKRQIASRGTLNFATALKKHCNTLMHCRKRRMRLKQNWTFACHRTCRETSKCVNMLSVLKLAELCTICTT